MNLPNDFTEYTRRLMGDELYGRLAAGLDSSDMPTSIRLNPFKRSSSSIVESLADSDVPWCTDWGRYLRCRPNFTFDPLLHAGVYYVQEAASMFVDYVVRYFIDRPVMMLDLCAAPGGKSTALRSALPEGSLLFSNEPVRTRAQILSENIQKFGHEDVVVTNNYPRDYRKSRLMFDAILADVPCSGEGMFRKDHGAREEWSLQNVENCWRLQRDIISDVWDNLKPGGLLIYSTCTFNAHEDEENVQWIAGELGADILSLPIHSEWGITKAIGHDMPAYRFLPGISRSEGLFLAVLRKHGEQSTVSPSKGTTKKNTGNHRKSTDKGNKKLPDIAKSLPLYDASDFCIRLSADNLVAIPARWADVYDSAAKSLKIMHAGVEIGTIKGKDVVPVQSLALSRRLDVESYPRVELDYVSAIAFLRKEAVVLPDATPKGFVVVCFNGQPLGFEKNIGNRANNLYPQEWRIKSTHVPEHYAEITGAPMQQMDK